MSLHTLVLAAGASRRFGAEPKQLARIAGETMLERSVQLARSVSDVTLVLGCEASRLAPYVSGTRVLVHSAWSEGIGSSIAFGVSGLPKETSAVLILLCDQVAVTETDLNALVECYKNNLHKDAPSIVCAKYAGRFGVPAIFPRAFFPQLMSLAGDVGAKKILEQNAVVDVCMDHAAIDIDTQENLIQFIQATSAGKEQTS